MSDDPLAGYAPGKAGSLATSVSAQRKMAWQQIRPIAVIGPTATGKSELAVNIAESVGGEIVNIDSMQLYRGMDVGTAKLPLADRRGIPHHQLDVLSVTETASVATYQAAAAKDVEDIRARGRVPIIVGGSMMYIQSLLDGWQFPATDPVVRSRYEARLDAIGSEALHGELAAVDPDAARKLLATDGRRIVRALEVVELTGQPYAASQPTIGQPRWDTAIFALDRDTEELDRRIVERTKLMFESGFIEEVRALVTVGLRDGVTASRAIGYSQVLSMLDGNISVAQAQEQTMIGTRRYVRRQRSWFRRDPRISWLDATPAPVGGCNQGALVDRVLHRWEA